MLKTGDKIKYTKENSLIGLPLGTVFTVTDVKGTVVALETKIEVGNMTGVAKCVMSYDEYEKYFEKVVNNKCVVENKNTWTEWRTISKNELYRIIDDFYNDYFIAEFITDFLTANNGITLTTRNNEKKTDLCVAFTLGGTNYKIKSTSCCNKVDKYNEIEGIEVALVKMFPKIVTLLSKNYIEENY